MDKRNEDSLLPVSWLTSLPIEKYLTLLRWGRKGLERTGLRRLKQPLVISDSDVAAAINHINSLPYTKTKDMPPEWGKKQLIEWVLDSLPNRYGVGTTFPVAAGIWGYIVPLGCEFIDVPRKENKLQVILLIRHVITDLSKLTTLD